MGYQKSDVHIIDYKIYHFNGCQLRGPKIDPAKPYIVCVGAAQTFGRFCPEPFPVLLSAGLGIQVFNLGLSGAIPAQFLDHGFLKIINNAKLAVIQVLSARCGSNSRFTHVNNQRGIIHDDYRVVPPVTFWRYAERKFGNRKIGKLVEETRRDYLYQMLTLIQSINVPRILFYISKCKPEDLPDRMPQSPFPHLIKPRMIKEMAKYCDAYVECVSGRGLPQRLYDKEGKPTEVKNPAWDSQLPPKTHNSYYPSPEMHEDAAKALEPVCREILHKPVSRESSIQTVNKKMKPVNYCKLPFQKVLIGGKGGVFFCCPPWLRKPIGNVFKEQDFDKVWNSETAQKIRASMIDGTYGYCNREYCPYLLNGKFKPIEKETSTDDNNRVSSGETVLSTGPEEMNLCYDNTCNLYCKYCRQQVITADEEKIDTLLKFQRNLINSPLFQNVRHLILAGQGEVFLSKVYLDLLKNIDEQRFPHLEITLYTNGILLTPANWEKISNAHYAVNHISVSVDAVTKETYNKVRRGGNFDKLLDNLKFLSQLKKNKELKLSASFVMQRENYKEMPAFVKLMKTYKVDSFYFGKLFNYGAYSGEEFRQAAVHREDHPEHNDFLEILRHPLLHKRGITIQMKKA